MGLDISYYSNIKKVLDKIDEEDDDYDEKVDNAYDISDFCVYGEEHFKYQLGELEIGAYYKGEYSMGFCAGSYGGYNFWRNQLSKLAGYSSDEEVWKEFGKLMRKYKLKKIEKQDISFPPFYELINFSDCEGTICSNVSKKLYEDFLKFDKKAKNIDDYFYKKYKEWTNAFKIASDNGAVCFH